MHECLQHRDACQVALECHRRRGLDVVAAGDNLGKLKGKKASAQPETGALQHLAVSGVRREVRLGQARPSESGRVTLPT
jgi:hypothetical protein